MKHTHSMHKVEHSGEESMLLKELPVVKSEQDSDLCIICGQYFVGNHACLQGLPSSLLTLQDPRVGLIVAGHFILEEFICASETSCVYKARHQLLNTYVAVKISNALNGFDQFSLLRTNRAALIASRLDHPNIVRTIELNCDNDDNPLLIMEWASGTPLSQLIGRESPIAPLRAINVIEALCDALRYAHSQGVNHINLKTSNIIIADHQNGSEQARLLDFGIMKMLGPHPVETIAKGQHSLYCSPEECSGLPPDERSMIYTLGVILFEMLTGSVEQFGHSDKTHSRINAPALVKVRPDLREAASIDEVLFKCIAPKSDQRFRNLDELGAALSQTKVQIERLGLFESIEPGHFESTEKSVFGLQVVLLIVAFLMLAYLAFHGSLAVH
jgi:serine/threonine-protein kinase